MSDVFECPFCSSKEPVLRENTHAQIVLSNPHKVPGHVLVMPKRHVEKPWELEPEEISAIFELIFFAQKQFLGKLGEGFDIRQNYRPFMKENELKVDHVVFHVIPRTSGDYLAKISGKYEQDLFADLDEVERDAVERLLR